MITIYTKENCPGCVQLKAKMKQEGKEYREVLLGRDMSVGEFLEKYPGIRAVPYVVEE